METELPAGYQPPKQYLQEQALKLQWSHQLFNMVFMYPSQIYLYEAIIDPTPIKEL
jgi:hypothetical protein